MRKKSHILLASYLMQEWNRNGAGQSVYKKAFYFGSVLPDLTPKMFVVPHEMDRSFPFFGRQIQAVYRMLEQGRALKWMFWQKLGVVLHYVADFFTFPHNRTFGGSLIEHGQYEAKLKYCLRRFVCTQQARELFASQQRRFSLHTMTPEQLLLHIRERHGRYLQKAVHTPADDCRWITEMASGVFLCAERWCAQFRREELYLPLAG